MRPRSHTVSKLAELSVRVSSDPCFSQDVKSGTLSGTISPGQPEVPFLPILPGLTSHGRAAGSLDAGETAQHFGNGFLRCPRVQQLGYLEGKSHYC